MKRMEHTIGSRMTGLMRLARIPLLTALTALAVVSCGGSDDAPDTPTPNPPIPPQSKVETPIAFSGSLSEGGSESHARTRATTTPLSATHQTFYAWAYKNPSSGSTETVMKNFTVNWQDGSEGSTTTNSRGWEYVNQQASGGTEQSVKYWDFDVTDYRFFGYAGTGFTADDTHTTGLDPYVTLVCTVDADDELVMTSSSPLYSKLWYKTGSAVAASILPVTLEFMRPIARVRFMYKASDESAVFMLDDQHFKPTDPEKVIVTAGTFTVTYPLSGDEPDDTKESWSVTGGTSSLPNGFEQDYYEDDNDPDTPADPNAGKWYAVLPANSQGPYTLSVKVNTVERSVVVPAEFMKWQPGYQYTYIFKISDDGILALEGVLSGFAPWNTTEATHSVFNW